MEIEFGALKSDNRLHQLDITNFPENQLTTVTLCIYTVQAALVQEVAGRRL